MSQDRTTSMQYGPYGLETSTFENGVLVSLRIDHDGSAGRPLDSSMLYFDAAGRIVRQEKTYLDGVVETADYVRENGTPNTTRIMSVTDAQNAYSWSELSTEQKYEEVPRDPFDLVYEHSIYESLQGTGSSIPSYWDAGFESYAFQSYGRDGAIYSTTLDDGTVRTKKYGVGYHLTSDTVINGASGIATTTAYQNGLRASETVVDLRNTQADYQSKISTFENFELAKLETVGDDGTVVTTEYANGRASMRTATDGGNHHHWQSHIATLDGEGRPVEATTVNDNGSVATTTYVGGIRNLARIDHGGGAGGATSVWTFDAEGDLVQSVKTAADGLVTTSAHLGGTVVRQAFSDEGNTFHWTSHVKLFDASGKLLSAVTLNDDGTSQLTEYTGGIRSRQVIDLDEAAGGLDSERTFDALGALSKTEWTTAEGAKVTSHYADGKIASRFVEDTRDAFVFESKSQTYENGTLARIVTEFDSGLTRTNDYADGILERRAFVDGGDEFRWQTRTIELDGQGKVTGVHTLWDDATVTDSVF